MVTIRRRKSVKTTHIACREGGDTIYPTKSLTQHNMESVKYIYQYIHIRFAFWVKSTSVGGGRRIVVKWYHVDSKLITSLWNDTSNSEVSRVRISATTESQVPIIFSFPLQNRDVILASKTNRMSRKRQTIDGYKNPVSDFSKFTKSENVPTALMAHCYHSCSRHFRNRSSSSLSRAVILRSSLRNEVLNASLLLLGTLTALHRRRWRHQ